MNEQDIRSIFPLIKARKYIYLDNASTTQKPQCLLESMEAFYQEGYANIHRGLCSLSEEASATYEKAREAISRYLGNVDPSGVIFTPGTTHGINLLAQAWSEKFLEPGGEIILPQSEHHSNIVPWQLAAKARGGRIVWAPLNPDYRLDLKTLKTLINSKTRLIAMAHTGNVLGLTHPVHEVVSLVKKAHGDCQVFIDGAQGVAQGPLNLKDLGCDAYAFGAHKMMGPSGVGALYVRPELLEKFSPPWGGGGMIHAVGPQESSWAPIPHRFEPGTPAITEIVGWKSVIDWALNLPWDELNSQKKAMAEEFAEAIVSQFPKMRLFPSLGGGDHVGIFSLVHESIHSHDLGSICASRNICVRSGHHCAQPLMKVLGVSSTLRVSPYIYNCPEDFSILIEALKEAEKIFS